MSEPAIPIPIICPLCGRRSLSEFRAAVVFEALETEQIRLYANCHVVSWDAGEFELKRLRKYFDGVYILESTESSTRDSTNVAGRIVDIDHYRSVE